ncbi:MAG: hypothetical protein RhofKO_36630 [Rhodothermales bacterium]
MVSLLLLVFSVWPLPSPATLNLQITGARSDDGQVVVLLFNSSEGFPRNTSKAAYTQAAPLENGAARLSLQDIPAGRYAIMAFHDADGNNKLKTNFMGMPKEGIALVGWTGGRPKFGNVAVEVSAEGGSFDLALNYR